MAQQARTTAMIQHTYIWLGFYSYTNLCVGQAVSP
jgi:hypothetical protein